MRDEARGAVVAHREELETLAESDLPIAEKAERLLELVE